MTVFPDLLQKGFFLLFTLEPRIAFYTDERRKPECLGESVFLMRGGKTVGQWLTVLLPDDQKVDMTGAQEVEIGLFIWPKCCRILLKQPGDGTEGEERVGGQQPSQSRPFLDQFLLNGTYENLELGS